MSNEWVDFKEIKAAVTMEMALEHYQVNLPKVNASTLRGKCPLPSHVGESDNSFAVNTEKNIFACHAGSCVEGRDGRKGGNVLDFVAAMEDCTIRDAALKLQDWFNVDASNERPTDYVPSRDRHNGNTKKKLVAKEKGSDDLRNSSKNDVESPCENGCDTPNKPLEFTLKSVDMSHDYFRRRGIREATAEHFGTGFFHGKGTMAGRVVIPIHSETGDLIGYAGRAVDDETERKYKLPVGFKKSLVLFNLHQVLSEGQGKAVILVEGFFDTMKIHQAGFPNVIALMGCEMSEHQEALLVECFDEVVIMLDGDKAGNYAATQIVARLMDKAFMRLVHVPEGKQPDQLSSEEILSLLAFLGKGGNGSG